MLCVLGSVPRAPSSVSRPARTARPTSIVLNIQRSSQRSAQYHEYQRATSAAHPQRPAAAASTQWAHSRRVEHGFMAPTETQYSGSRGRNSFGGFRSSLSVVHTLLRAQGGLKRHQPRGTEPGVQQLPPHRHTIAPPHTPPYPPPTPHPPPTPPLLSHLPPASPW